MKTREYELLEAARRFHLEHPEVWDLFSTFTHQKILQGHQHYSADAIMHRVRWETDAGNGRAVVNGFKINNNFVTFYAEGFMRKYPQYDGFFRRRARPSSETEAKEPD